MNNMRSTTDVFPTRHKSHKRFPWPIYPSEAGFIDDGIIDDVAVSRAFYGDRGVLDRLTPAERCKLAERMLAWWLDEHIPGRVGKTRVDPSVAYWAKSWGLDPEGLQSVLHSWNRDGLPAVQRAVFTYSKPVQVLQRKSMMNRVLRKAA